MASNIQTISRTTEQSSSQPSLELSIQQNNQTLNLALSRALSHLQDPPANRHKLLLSGSDPTSQPSRQPSGQPSAYPSFHPTIQPTLQPNMTSYPSNQTNVTSYPTSQPTLQPNTTSFLGNVHSTSLPVGASTNTTGRSIVNCSLAIFDALICASTSVSRDVFITSPTSVEERNEQVQLLVSSSSTAGDIEGSKRLLVVASAMVNAVNCSVPRTPNCTALSRAL